MSTCIVLSFCFHLRRPFSSIQNDWKLPSAHVCLCVNAVGVAFLFDLQCCWSFLQSFVQCDWFGSFYRVSNIDTYVQNIAHGAWENLGECRLSLRTLRSRYIAKPCGPFSRVCFQWDSGVEDSKIDHNSEREGERERDKNAKENQYYRPLSFQRTKFTILFLFFIWMIVIKRNALIPALGHTHTHTLPFT